MAFTITRPDIFPPGTVISAQLPPATPGGSPGAPLEVQQVGSDGSATFAQLQPGVTYLLTGYGNTLTVTPPAASSGAGSSSGGSAARIGPRIAGLGDSITAFNGALPKLGLLGYLTNAMLLSGGRISLAGAVGLSGQTAATIAAQGLPEVLELDPAPNACIVVAGTNDAFDTDVTGALEALGAMYDGLLEAGILPIAASIPPHTGVGAPQLANIAAINAYAAHRASTGGFPFVDLHRALVDPATGGWRNAAWTSDGIHPTEAGAKVMGQAIVDALSPLIAYRAPLRDDGVQSLDLIPNGLFKDSDANGLADGWQLVIPGSGAATSIIAGAGDVAGNWQRFTKTGGQADYALWWDSFGHAVVAGHRLRWAGRVKLLSVAAGATVFVNLTDGANGNPILAPDGANWFELQGAGSSIDGAFELEWEVPAGVASVILGVGILGGDGDVQVAQHTLTDLTALGL